MGSPAQGELMRGDVITKIGDYDARDLMHIDAKNLFKSAENSIQVVVHRDNKLAVTKNIVNGSEASTRCSSAVPPYSPNINLLSPNVASLLDAGAANPHRYAIININISSKRPIL